MSASVEVERRYAARLAGLSAAEVSRLDPALFRGTAAVQPDQRTCGSASLVMARMINRPAYAMAVLTGYDPESDRTDAGTPAQRFAAECVAMHARTNSWRDRTGRVQVPWPQALGTAPWSVARELSVPGGSGVPGTSYAVLPLRLSLRVGDRDASFDRISASVRAGHAVPVFVGSDLLPRHVVLAVGVAGDTLRFYEPSAGAAVSVERAIWCADAARLGGWARPWAAVVPRIRRTA